MAEFRQLLQHRVVKEEMKKRDISGKQREAAKDILIEAGVMGDVKQELELTKALQKKKVNTVGRASFCIQGFLVTLG
jgi:transposase